MLLVARVLHSVSSSYLHVQSAADQVRRASRSLRTVRCTKQHSSAEADASVHTFTSCSCRKKRIELQRAFRSLVIYDPAVVPAKLPGDNRTRLNSSTSSKYEYIIKTIVPICSIPRLSQNLQFCSYSQFAALRALQSTQCGHLFYPVHLAVYNITPSPGEIRPRIVCGSMMIWSSPPLVGPPANGSSIVLGSQNLLLVPIELRPTDTQPKSLRTPGYVGGPPSPCAT